MTFPHLRHVGPHGAVISALERTTEMREITYCVALPFVAADDGIAPVLQRERGSDARGGAETWLCSRGRST